jgi:branched-subunit amino acid aminotransferase/4-amino-4-deoxychorismate lyase
MVKSLNYLNNVMAKVEAIQAGAEEGVMLNETGLVAECTGDNIFIRARWRDNHAATHRGRTRWNYAARSLRDCQRLGHSDA